MLDVVIIGSGPAGITAAIYAKRANLNVAVVEKEYLGTGQIAESSRINHTYYYVHRAAELTIIREFRESTVTASVKSSVSMQKVSASNSRKHRFCL